MLLIAEGSLEDTNRRDHHYCEHGRIEGEFPGQEIACVGALLKSRKKLAASFKLCDVVVYRFACWLVVDDGSDTFVISVCFHQGPDGVIAVDCSKQVPEILVVFVCFKEGPEMIIAFAGFEEDL
ncbi:hypothetical protein TASIC1_0009027300 [Trichoderma asperellum]|uniref:Uncharacterized protein n=1 Tax=Trichoderma asperellum TaxID=101201 RepID=A0A6V8R1G9_TRIAP|nr:hypothetical protein TASIC1_0009027300 [Trichoderma asperellum]